MPSGLESNAGSGDENTPLFDENTTPRSLRRAARELQASLNSERSLTQNLRRKFEDVSNTSQDGDNDTSSPHKKRRRIRAESENCLDSDEAGIQEAEADEVKRLGRRFVILHGPWLRRKEAIFEVELDEDYDEEDRFKDSNTMVQGQLHEIRGLLPDKYHGDAFTKKWLSKSFTEGMDSQRSNTATRLRKLAAAIFSVDALHMSPSTIRTEKFRDMIGWTINQHGRGSYSALKVAILHKDYSGAYDRAKVFLNPSLMALFVALIRGPNAAIEMIKGNFGIRPMTETMEVIHGIRNITPGAIATTAMLAIWCLSGDDSLQQRGATTGINYMALYEDYLKLIASGLHRDRAEFINVIQQWDEVVFPSTETSIVVGHSSSGDTENEVDREIGRMDDEERS
ncbi:hypothetical protein B0H34DRAFT_731613 [Crassisporium funariophilum]|nr:hypothetical protein B0H34DRAFT_731613 [Crassisporium funariophilum]